jgi:hypothetical protein
MKKSKVIFKRSFILSLVNALLILALLLLLSACDNNSTTQPDGTITQPTDTSLQPTDTVIPTQAPSYFILNLSPIPDIENPGELEIVFTMLEPDRYDNLVNSHLDLEFYWTNIYGSYSEAKRAELIPIDEVLVSGDTTWEGDASVNRSITLHSQIILPREGVWKIKATFSTNDDVQLTDSIKVAVAEGTSVIMYTEEFYSSPLAYLANFSYGGISEKYLDELHPIFIALDISKAPLVGEEVTLTYRIESLYEVPNFSTQFVVYKRTIGVAEERVSPDKIISGNNLSWQGDLIPGQPIVVTSTIVFPEEGDWKIGVRRDEGRYFDYIWINVTDTRGSFGWEDPQINPCVTITTPSTTIPTTTPTTPTTTIPSENTTPETTTNNNTLP